MDGMWILNYYALNTYAHSPSHNVIRSFLVIIVITKQYTGSFLGNIETPSIKVLYIYVSYVI